MTLRRRILMLLYERGPMRSYSVILELQNARVWFPARAYSVLRKLVKDGRAKSRELPPTAIRGDRASYEYSITPEGIIELAPEGQ